MACHGRNGARGIQEYPNIAGLDANYIRMQVKDILSKKRQGSDDPVTGHPRSESMRGSLVTAEGEMRISDDEIKILAAWLSEQMPAGPQVHEPALDADRIAAGEAAYTKAKCRTCHGVGGNKALKGYPRLAGQKSAYLVAQMVDIRDGARKNGRARMMLPFVKRLSDDDIALMADYLSQIDPNQ
jgi:cytochrome c553